jgi:hypothetical protein
LCSGPSILRLLRGRGFHAETGDPFLLAHRDAVGRSSSPPCPSLHPRERVEPLGAGLFRAHPFLDDAEVGSMSPSATPPPGARRGQGVRSEEVARGPPPSSHMDRSRGRFARP